MFTLLLLGCRLPVPPPVMKALDRPVATDGPTRLILIGDAGYGPYDRKGIRQHDRDPVLVAAGAAAAATTSDRTAVVLLGDNVYGRKPSLPRAYGGLPPCREPSCWDEVVDGGLTRIEYVQLLDQLAIAESGAPLWTIPGNHDWYRGVKGIRAQRELTETYARERGLDVEFLPRLKGPRIRTCDGAAEVSTRIVGPAIEVVILDSQAAIDCPDQHPRLRDALWTAVRRSTRPLVVVAGHHPARTLGPHGRRAFHSNLTSQDIPARAYSRYVDRVLNPPLTWQAGGGKTVLYAAGHEHMLEVLQPRGLRGFDRLIVSGAGTTAHDEKTDPVARDALRADEFVSNRAGFVQLDVTDDGATVVLKVVTVRDDGSTHLDHQETLPLEAR